MFLCEKILPPGAVLRSALNLTGFVKKRRCSARISLPVRPSTSTRGNAPHMMPYKARVCKTAFVQLLLCSSQFTVKNFQANPTHFHSTCNSKASIAANMSVGNFFSIFVLVWTVLIPRSAKAQECQTWCVSNPQEWEEKCTWLTTCGGCPKCTTSGMLTGSKKQKGQKGKPRSGTSRTCALLVFERLAG